MNREGKWLRRIFTAVMLIFCLGLAGWTVLRTRTDFQLEDLTRSLETSRGRERKQQQEYDEAAAQLPLVLEELAAAEPKAEKAKAEVKELKQERNRLREEKKEHGSP